MPPLVGLVNKIKTVAGEPIKSRTGRTLETKRCGWLPQNISIRWNCTRDLIQRIPRAEITKGKTYCTTIIISHTKGLTLAEHTCGRISKMYTVCSVCLCACLHMKNICAPNIDKLQLFIPACKDETSKDLYP